MASHDRCLEILRQLHHMKLILDSSALEFVDSRVLDANNNSSFLERNGSIRGRRNFVQQIVKTFTDCEKKTCAENTGIIVYMTSCGILRRAYDKCRIAMDLLEALHVKYTVRDLNIEAAHIEVLQKKLNMRIIYARDFIFDSLPLIYMDGNFLGNEQILVELNDRGSLTRIVGKYRHTRSVKCARCLNRGYVICEHCHGSRRHVHVNNRLRCSFCDENGISRCPCCCCQKKS